MTTTKIQNAEVEPLKVASLPARPTAPTAFGGMGYTATEMKAAFDRLPLYLVEKFNSLLDDIEAEGSTSLAGAVPTGVSEGHTLSDLFADLLTGAFAGYLSIGNSETLSAAIAAIRADVALLEAVANGLSSMTLDCGTPEDHAQTDEAATVKLLRADEAGWAENDLILPDGAPAILRTASGDLKIKIGDGTTPFSALKSTGCDVVRSYESSDSRALYHGFDYRYGVLSYLGLSVPALPADDFCAYLSFDSGETPTTLVYPAATILFSGDDVSGQAFVPDAMKHYSLVFWYDGMMQCAVRGTDYV